MRKITQEEKAVFEKAMKLTGGVHLNGLRIVLWGIFCPWRQYLFLDSLMDGMHWWAAYDRAKNAKKQA